MDFDWKSLLKTVAPALATAFGGPLAGIAVTAVGNALNVPEPTQEKIQAALAGATPDDLLKVKQADQQFLKDMKSLDVDVFKTEVADRTSARQAAVAGGTANHLFWLSVLLLMMCLGAELVVLFVGYPPTIPEIVVGRVLGLLDSVAMMVLAFWYGTTKGSQNKDETIKALAS